MFKVLLGLSLTAFILSAITVRANEDVLNATTEVEDITADSEAALRLAKEAKLRAAKERQESARALLEAEKTKKTVAVKKDEANVELKMSEGEIQIQLAEQARLKKQMEKLSKEMAAAEKTILDSRNASAKAKGETQALLSLRNEKQAKLAELNKTREATLAETKTVEQQHAEAKAEFDKAKQAEKVAAEQLDTTKREEAAKRSRLQAQIAGFKERYRLAEQQREALEKEIAKVQAETAKLEAQAKVAEAEVNQAESRMAEVKLKAPLPAPAQRKVNAESSDMVLKKDCNVRNAPSRTADVLEIKLGGTAISHAAPSQGWITFPYGEGKLGYVAKTCF